MKTPEERQAGETATVSERIQQQLSLMLTEINGHAFIPETKGSVMKENKNLHIDHLLMDGHVCFPAPGSTLQDDFALPSLMALDGFYVKLTQARAIQKDRFSVERMPL